MTVKSVKQPQLGKLLRELRLENELTQEQFAAVLGVTYSTVNRWENGRSQPLPLARQRILQVLEQMGDSGKKLLAKYLAN